VDTAGTGQHNGQSERNRRVRLLCRTGYAHYDAGEPARALRHFYRAWLLLPRPQHACIESGWILTAIGDAYWLSGDCRSGAEALRSALHCPGIAGNPFVHLRLAQCCEALGLAEEAVAQRAIAAHNGTPDSLEREHRMV
jgi:tetratricopeptide (TPR) repeat protein